MVKLNKQISLTLEEISILRYLLKRFINETKKLRKYADDKKQHKKDIVELRRLLNTKITMS